VSLLLKSKHDRELRPITPRIAPLEPPYEPDVEAALAKWMPPDAGIEPLRLFRTLQVHEQLASRMRVVGAGILGGKALVPPTAAGGRDPPDLRPCRRRVRVGRARDLLREAAGFHRRAAPLDRARVPDDPCWDADQSAVFRLSDELHETGTLSDALWESLAARFDEAQIVELIATAGWYHLIGYVCNGARVDLEEWGARFPAR
jgi:hypothetical protein